MIKTLEEVEQFRLATRRAINGFDAQRSTSRVNRLPEALTFLGRQPAEGCTTLAALLLRSHTDATPQPKAEQ
jgi:hypothetical protein